MIILKLILSLLSLLFLLILTLLLHYLFLLSLLLSNNTTIKGRKTLFMKKKNVDNLMHSIFIRQKNKNGTKRESFVYKT